MKLSSRKQLLAEAEQELKAIRNGIRLGESSVLTEIDASTARQFAEALAKNLKDKVTPLLGDLFKRTDQSVLAKVSKLGADKESVVDDITQLGSKLVKTESIVNEGIVDILSNIKSGTKLIAKMVTVVPVSDLTKIYNKVREVVAETYKSVIKEDYGDPPMKNAQAITVIIGAIVTIMSGIMSAMVGATVVIGNATDKGAAALPYIIALCGVSLVFTIVVLLKDYRKQK